MEKLNNEYDVLKAQLKALGGDDTQDFDSKYQVMVAILEAIKQGGGGGGGLTPEQVRAIVESYNYTTMSAVENKKYMNQKKLTLNGDATAIVDEDGNTLTYAQVKALVDNKALFVYLLVDNAFYIPCGDMVVPSGHNAVEFSSAFIVSGEASIARIIIDTENEVIYEQYWLADKDWIRTQGYTTMSAVEAKGYLTSVPAGYATESYVDTKIGDINTALETIIGA